MMKSVVSILFVILSAAPVLGGYDAYNAQKDGYTPPVTFMDRPALASGEDEHKGPVPDHRYTSAKKTAMEEMEAADAGRGINPALFQRMSEMATAPTGVATLADHIRKRVELEELKALTLLRHPGIQAAQKKVAAEIQSFDQISNLDDSLRQYAAFTRSLDNRVGPIKAGESIKMGFPSPGVSGLKGRIVAARVSMSIEETARVRQQVLKDAAVAYWDLVYVEEATRVTRETISALERLRDVATSLYRSGKTSFQDVIKINIKLEELQEGLVSLKLKRGVIQARILELISLTPENGSKGIQIGPAGKSALPPSIPDTRALYPMAQRHRQELRALRFNIARVTAMVALAETMVEAKSSLGLSLSDNGFINTTGTDAPGQAFADRTMAAMKNSSPTRAWYGVSEPWLAQTRQTLLGLRQNLEAKENAANRMVQDGWFKADQKAREYRLYRSRILPLAKSALDVSTKEYESGAIPFSQAIDSYTYWLRVKLLIAQRQSELGQAVAELENIIGIPITP